MVTSKLQWCEVTVKPFKPQSDISFLYREYFKYRYGTLHPQLRISNYLLSNVIYNVILNENVPKTLLRTTTWSKFQRKIFPKVIEGQWRVNLRQVSVSFWGYSLEIRIQNFKIFQFRTDSSFSSVTWLWQFLTHLSWRLISQSESCRNQT